MNADIVQNGFASIDLPANQANDRLSALVDGEIPPDELDALLLELADDALGQATCERYQLIGDLVRECGTSARTGSPHVFVAGVRARLDAEQLQPVAIAARTSEVMAANDPVFRWKLVAGMASVAAVMAVSWSLLSVAPGSAGSSADAQVAQVAPSTATLPAAAMVVNTEQGPVIRDARLEELLAEHRQYGGMSALQMPAGFLRDATYQSAPQR